MIPVEAARTVTAEQVEAFRFALINYEHKVASAIDAERFDEPDQDAFVAEVVAALGLTVEGAPRRA